MNATKGGWFSSLQRFVTGAKYTHCALAIGDWFGVPTVLEAELTICADPWQRTLDDPTISYEVYRPKLPREVLEPIVKRLYEDGAGRTYAFAMLLWFVYRGIAEMFGCDVRRKKNWFTKGWICSKETYKACWAYSSAWPKYTEVLDMWTENTFNPGDQRWVLFHYPQYFDMVEKRDAK